MNNRYIKNRFHRRWLCYFICFNGAFISCILCKFKLHKNHYNYLSYKYRMLLFENPYNFMCNYVLHL